MDAAWIAVIGTLARVTITATTSIVASILTARYQRETSERQLAINADERLRKEVRESFVDYFATYNDLRDRIIVLRQQIDRDRATGQEMGQRTIEEFAASESARFSRAYHTLRISASTATGDAAHRATAQLWALARAAELGNSESFDRIWSESPPLRPELHRFSDHRQRGRPGSVGPR